MQTKEKIDMNSRQKLVIIIMDVLILAELVFSIFRGSRDPEYLPAIFVRTYVPMLVITLVGGRILFKKFRTPEPAEETAS